MGRRSRVILINEKDNVATALEPLEAGTVIALEVGGRTERVAISSAVPPGHKFALRQIEAGEAVVKYGEPIGDAVKGIAPGEHVHVHNVVSKGKKVQGAR
jgi:altronate dehydratase small subunit